VNHALIKEAILYGTVLAAMNVSDFSVQGLVGKSMSEIDNYKDRLIKWTS
jgi:hypothetical protein